jgi:RNA polymerase sigma-70 factor (ECF subfamily)
MRAGETSLGGPHKEFPNTVWEIVARAQDPSTGLRQTGLEQLCQRYWKPVYHYIWAAWAKTNDEAKDLTQDFFLWLLEGDAIRKFAPQRASFRTYLTLLLTHFLQDQDRAAHRIKRGGRVRILDLDGEVEPLRKSLVAPESEKPDRIFDLAFRNELMEHAVALVRERFVSGGRGHKFQIFEQIDLSPSGQKPTLQAVADASGVKLGDVKNFLSAVREEVRSELRAELAAMAAGADELEEEWNAFFGG